MGAASRMKIVHYTDNPPEKDEKKAMSLCGSMLPMKGITRNQKEANCFLCREKLHENK